MPAFHAAIRQNRRAEPTEKLQSVEVHGAGPSPAGLAGGTGPRTVRERDEAAMGERDLEDIRSEGVQGGVGVGQGLAVDGPGDSPDSWIELP
jgi:hypothetical protein